MGNIILALRNNLRLSQAELAKQCGVTQQFIQLVEKGKRAPSLRIAARLAEALGVTVNDLIGRG